MLTNHEKNTIIFIVNSKCKTCKKSFSVKPSWIKAGYGKYCSKPCRAEASKKGKIVSCYECGEQVYKSRKALNGSKSGNYFCGKSCQTTWRNTHFSKEKHPNYKHGHNAYRRILLQSDKEQYCRLCQTVDKRVLAAHHIDHDHFNHDIENLTWLCHNCHHLVHHDKKEHERFMATIV